MKEKEIINVAKRLVNITITKHNENTLGNEKISTFIKRNLPKNIKESDYNNILHLYNKFLAKEGYEIRKDITKFDIINYNKEEYLLYISSLINK